MEEQKHKEIGENGSKEIWSQPILLKDINEQPQQQAIVMAIMADASFKRTKVNNVEIAPPKDKREESSDIDDWEIPEEDGIEERIMKMITGEFSY